MLWISDVDDDNETGLGPVFSCCIHLVPYFADSSIPVHTVFNLT